jgi:hypothetical protein
MAIRFELGRLVATPGALAALRDLEIHPLSLVKRHLAGDWSEMSVEDQQANDNALMDGSRIFSAYEVKGQKIWIITEAADDSGKRFSTCILLPEEY